jgi:glyoxylase-like metal-dependent hydrolase (beta-lactamase superfamily II)
MSVQFPEPILIVKRVGHVRIHTFISAFTANNIANATHIIESENALVLIDGQFLAHYAREFRSYADRLTKNSGKKIVRLYLSHFHPDHWFGLGTAFTDIPIYALPETIDAIKQHGAASREDHLKKLGDQAPPEEIIEIKNAVAPKLIDRIDPLRATEADQEAIDGVRYVFSKITNTEIDFLLTIGLPDLGIFIAQDLLYSGTHLYLTANMKHWIEVLGELLTSDYELFLAGHGFPADKTEVAKNAEYLTAAQYAQATESSKYDFKPFLLQRYPERLCPGIFDTYLPRLFDGARPY